MSKNYTYLLQRFHLSLIADKGYFGNYMEVSHIGEIKRRVVLLTGGKYFRDDVADYGQDRIGQIVKRPFVTADDRSYTEEISKEEFEAIWELTGAAPQLKYVYEQTPFDPSMFKK